VDFVYILSDWLTYATDKVNARVPQRVKNVCILCHKTL